MQKLAHSTVATIRQESNARAGRYHHKLLVVGAIAPMESAPMTKVWRMYLCNEPDLSLE